MAEYIVEFDKEPYDQMVADGILKETDNPTLYGMPVRGEIIRCKDCKHLVGDCEYIWCEQTGRCVKQDGFCAWAERDETC